MPHIKYFIFLSFTLFWAFSGQSQSPSIDTQSAQSLISVASDSLGEYGDPYKAIGLIDSLDQAGIIDKEVIQQTVLDSISNNSELAQFWMDSLTRVAKNDPRTQIRQDTSLFQPSGRVKRDVETTVDYKATDSMYFDLKAQKIYMYGDGDITYGNINLKADSIEMDWTENTLSASSRKDSTGKMISKPVFTDAGDVYETKDMVYNFKSRKALINGVITEQDGGFMHGERVKKNEKDELFVRHARYTTCDLAHPHFHIQASKLKAIPGDKIVSGPFNLHFGNIPTPIGFAFGIFPEPQESRSGIIFPGYGEDQNRGFFLRQFGYYFYINDYMDLKATGDLYSNGSYGVNGNYRYRVRYNFNGNMNVRYNKTNSTNFEDDSFSKDLWVTWSHTPESRGSSRFSASVNAGTSSFTANSNDINQDFNRNVSAEFSSNVSYSKTFKGTPFSMAANARHSQNIATDVVRLTLPDLSVNASRIQPFKNIGDLKNTPLGKLGFSYRFASKNELSNGPASKFSGFDVANEDPLADSIVSFNSENMDIILARAKQGIRHQVPVSTSFNVAKYFTVSPSFNYSEVWYGKELSYTDYDQDAGGVRVDTLQGFSRAGWWSTGASVNTRLYGFYPLGTGKIQAIRHVLTPSAGISYSPDFSSPGKGTYKEVVVDSLGNTRTLSKYEGFAYGGPTGAESATVSFSLNNNLEMKVRNNNDSISETKKIKIFDNLSMSSGYNLLADSFNLSNINWNARTSFFNSAISVNMSGTIDPYVYLLDSVGVSDQRVYQRKIDKYAWNNGQGLGQLTRMSLAVGFSLSPGKFKQTAEEAQAEIDQAAAQQADNPFVQTTPEQDFLAGNVNHYISKDPNEYVPFDLPWQLSVNYSMNYTKTGFEDHDITHGLTFRGSLSLTDKTQINMSSGYDVSNKEFTYTQISANRDLHCWNLSFNWVPFGVRQSYFVSIRVNSPLLKDLKLDKRQTSPPAGL
ncbi:putative LPS assembly protein LptD [Reichenbachiella versicolor]|uniref:putative LPS assembly protein LptD n=1 Tax=Reichenbachiella versicolor TaxID=1821036 RepID=UPI0013A56EF2|nr:putative LPS assembly protein LptD [Reichenbachiella versicolor]